MRRIDPATVGPIEPTKIELEYRSYVLAETATGNNPLRYVEWFETIKRKQKRTRQSAKAKRIKTVNRAIQHRAARRAAK